MYIIFGSLDSCPGNSAGERSPSARILGELRETNPDVLFFLENVEMGEKWESVLTKAIGIPGVHIDSALVCAQHRRRIYWTNIKTKTEGFFGWTVEVIKHFFQFLPFAKEAL